MVSCGLLLLVLTVPGVASGGIIEHAIATESGIVVYSASDDGSVVIREGRISAMEGRSIRLLPGTHVKAGDELAVCIVSKEYHEELAAELARERREQTVESLLAKGLHKPLELDFEILLRNPLNIPGLPSQLDRQMHCWAGVQIRVQGSPTPPVSNLLTTETIINIHNHMVLAHVPLCFPDYSWGSRAETIKVMRS